VEIAYGCLCRRGHTGATALRGGPYFHSWTLPVVRVKLVTIHLRSVEMVAINGSSTARNLHPVVTVTRRLAKRHESVSSDAMRKMVPFAGILVEVNDCVSYDRGR
jgi:hypothetical protein